MLDQSPYDVPALFSSSSILNKSLHNSLLVFLTALALAIGNFDQRIEDSPDTQWLRLSQSEALPLLRFERDVACITMFIIKLFKSSAIQTADLF